MESKRADVHKKVAAPVLKSRNVSSLKSKGDVTGSATKFGIKASTPIKSSSSSLKDSFEVSSSLSNKSADKGVKCKSQVSLKEVTTELHNEEGSRDATDNVLNSYGASNAFNVLLKKAEHRIRGDVDKQIAGLQKRVNENLNALEETRLKVNKLHLLQEQSDLLSHHRDACQAFSNEPAFTQGRSFEELMTEIDRIKNQLPCKHISIPETTADLVDFQNAASQLLDSLVCISSVYGSDQTPISSTTTNLNVIDKSQKILKDSKLSIEAVSTKAGTSVLHETILKTADLDLL